MDGRAVVRGAVPEFCPMIRGSPFPWVVAFGKLKGTPGLDGAVPIETPGRPVGGRGDGVGVVGATGRGRAGLVPGLVAGLTPGTTGDGAGNGVAGDTERGRAGFVPGLVGGVVPEVPTGGGMFSRRGNIFSGVPGRVRLRVSFGRTRPCWAGEK